MQMTTRWCYALAPIQFNSPCPIFDFTFQLVFVSNWFLCVNHIINDHDGITSFSKFFLIAHDEIQLDGNKVEISHNPLLRINHIAISLAVLCCHDTQLTSSLHLESSYSHQLPCKLFVQHVSCLHFENLLVTDVKSSGRLWPYDMGQSWSPTSKNCHRPEVF